MLLCITNNSCFYLDVNFSWQCYFILDWNKIITLRMQQIFFIWLHCIWRNLQIYLIAILLQLLEALFPGRAQTPKGPPLLDPTVGLSPPEPLFLPPRFPVTTFVQFQHWMGAYVNNLAQTPRKQNTFIAQHSFSLAEEQRLVYDRGPLATNKWMIRERLIETGRSGRSDELGAFEASLQWKVEIKTI